MKCICKICGYEFEWERPKSYYGPKPKLCNNTDCTVKNNHLSYLKWKEKQPYFKWDGKGDRPKLREYAYRNTPQPKQYPCGMCGKLNSSRFNCSECLSKIDLNDDFVYCESGWSEQ